MRLPKMLVTGAAGKTGGAVATELIRQGWPVRAIVRRRDTRSERLDRLGVETVVADLFDHDQLLQAMHGTQRAYYCPPMHSYMIQSASAFLIAAREAKLESIVQMSQWLSSRTHPALLTRQTWLIDQLFSTSGINHTIVNPGMFADNFLRLFDFAALLGIYPVLTSKGRSAPVSNEDIARVVVAVLADPGRHSGMSYRPTGPRLLSTGDMVAVMEKVLGSRVWQVEMPMWMFTRAARLQGVPAFDLSSLRFYLEELRRGLFELDSGTNNTIEELTGAPAEDFETTTRRYAAMPFARRTMGNRLRAFINLMRVPFSPGYDLDRYDRQMLHPVPPQPRFAIEDDRWHEEHDLRLSTRRQELRVSA